MFHLATSFFDNRYVYPKYQLVATPGDERFVLQNFTLDESVEYFVGGILPHAQLLLPCESPQHNLAKKLALLDEFVGSGGRGELFPA